MSRSLAAAILAALIVLIAPQAASAAVADPPPADGPMTWAVVPATAEGPDGRGRIDLVVEPGDLYLEHVAVRNLGERSIVVDLAVLDAAQAADGSFQLLDEGGAAQGVAAWSQLDAASVTVPPRSHVVVAVAFEVPADAEPGDHVGGLVAAATVEGADGASVRYQTGTRVSLRVSGPIEPALAVDGLGGEFSGGLFGPGSIEVGAALLNTGTVRLSPSATVRVSALFGLWRAEVPLAAVGELLPGATGAASALLEGVPPLGPIEVVVDFTEISSHGQSVGEITLVDSSPATVWAVPGGILALLVAAVVLAGIALAARRARRTH